MVQDNIDWAEYFKHIKSVCPWSNTAYQKGEIKIKVWDGEWEHLGDNKAIVYIVKNTNRRRLKKLCRKLDNSLEYVWLWSEPRYGDYAAPTHVLVQQDRIELAQARVNIGYYD
jgi:hypothetical protein